MRDPNFLKSILPLTSELNAILSRIFELDPSKRCTISELKEMILSCDRLTTLSPVSQCYSPPYSPVDCGRDAAFGNLCPQEPIHAISQLPSPLVSPVANTFSGYMSPRLSQFSNSSGSSDSDTGSVFSDASSASSNSSTSSFAHITQIPKVAPPAQHQYVAPPPAAWYTIPSHIHRMANYFQAFQHHAPMPQLQVC
jgi:serine/threonine protein kinase